jgi:hypothetical protein
MSKVFAIVYGGVTYGYSRSFDAAYLALERGKKRGVKTAKIVERKSPPHGLRANQWFTPFDERRAGFY